MHPDFFRVFGVAPVAGRPFTHDDARRSAVVSSGFARRNFGSAAAALGQSVFIENRPYAIVGVMPPEMQFPAGTEVWAAAPIEPANRNRTGHNYRAVARLAAGVPVEIANAHLTALATRLASAFPESNLRPSVCGDRERIPCEADLRRRRSNRPPGHVRARSAGQMDDHRRRCRRCAPGVSGVPAGTRALHAAPSASIHGQ